MRDAAARQAEEAEQAYDEALAAFQEEFRKTAPFAEAIKAAQEAEHTFQEADRKAELAASDRDEKGKPYEDDPLFMYLWERKFGTSAYEGSGLARLLDRWVARLIGYVDAAANYRMLLEIPKRLREHAAALSAELEQRRAALQTLEEEARAAHPAGGWRPALRRSSARSPIWTRRSRMKARAATRWKSSARNWPGATTANTARPSNCWPSSFPGRTCAASSARPN